MKKHSLLTDVLFRRLAHGTCLLVGLVILASMLPGAGYANLSGPVSNQTPLAVAGDENWAGIFSLNGTDWSIAALTTDSTGNLYAGGSFTVAGNAAANYVARWNASASSWSALGSGIDGNLPRVSALASDNGGNIYAGGSFGAAGDVSANSIAEWVAATNSWQALGSGVDGEVYALAADSSGNVYAGGRFDHAGGVLVNNIAKWVAVTSSWQALGSGVGGSVYAVAVDGSGNVYAGGAFTRAGGVSANDIARWNPSTSSWEVLGSGVDSEVHAVAADNSGNIYVGGYFNSAGGVSANHIARWNVSTNSWQALGNGVDGLVYAVAVDGSGSVYAGGSFTAAGGVAVNSIARWNGSSWSSLGSGTNDRIGHGTIFDLEVDNAGNVYASGWFSIAGGVVANHIAKWNASSSSWSSLGAGSGVDTYVTAVAANGSIVYATGAFYTADGIVVNRIAQWKTSTNTWAELGSGFSFDNNTTPMALATDGSGNLYAGGCFNRAGGTGVSNIAKWNALTNSWEALGPGIGGGCVSALLVDSGGNVYAGGSFTLAGGAPARGIARWNPSTQHWAEVGGGIANGTNRVNVYALAVDSSGDLYVGGTFTQAGNVPVNNLAKWNVSADRWELLGGGIPSMSDSSASVRAIAFDRTGNLYAGGHFSVAGNVYASNIARWNGSYWLPLGTGTDVYSVNALAIDRSGNVYAGGDFGTAGGIPAKSVAKWNASTRSWQALGSGIRGGPVVALTLSGSSLFAGGSFTIAGGKVSAYVAQWTVPPTLSNVAKLGDKNATVAFTALDFVSAFSQENGSALAKIKILTLPAHGTLRFGALTATAGQEIALADLGKLSFTPDADWLGTTDFGWNGTDGTAYAANGASVIIKTAVLQRSFFPGIFR